MLVLKSFATGLAMFGLLVFSAYSYAVDRALKVTVKSSAGVVEEVELYSGYHALVIGVGEYQKGWPSLPNAIRDAREVAEMFRSMEWNVKALENPSGYDIHLALNELVTGPGQDKEKGVLVWYSGHGHTLDQADGTPLGYLVPSDSPNPDIDRLGFMQTAVDMGRIEKTSKMIRAKHVLMLFDSCFSGALFSTTRSAQPSTYIQSKTLKPVRQYITAGQANETVSDDSVFKDVFIQGVGDGYADLNEDGYVTGQELGSYLTELVTNYTNGLQNPQYGTIRNAKLDKGDFVFIRPEQYTTTKVHGLDPRVLELELWRNIKDSKDSQTYEEFLSKFPKGIYAGLAKLRLSKLQKATTKVKVAAPESNNAVYDVVPRPVAGNPKPVYPRLAIRRQLEGTVILTVDVLPSGKVANTSVETGSGSTLLDQAAIIAVSQWRYTPARRAGAPTMAVTQSIQFQLGGGGHSEESKSTADIEREAGSALGALVSAIEKKVRNNWSLPGEFTGLAVTISVKVTRTGEVTLAQVVRSSGNSLFDKSAVTALMKASPLPFPEEPRYYEFIKEFHFVFRPQN